VKVKAVAAKSIEEGAVSSRPTAAISFSCTTQIFRE
jgi:hypothetical protein